MIAALVIIGVIILILIVVALFVAAVWAVAFGVMDIMNVGWNFWGFPFLVFGGANRARS